MKKNAETMKEVASLCSKYCSCDDCGCKNSTSANASCQNCTHYDANLFNDNVVRINIKALFSPIHIAQ